MPKKTPKKGHTSPKTDMTLEKQQFEDVSRNLRLNMMIFHCHVSFWGCTSTIAEILARETFHFQ